MVAVAAMGRDATRNTVPPMLLLASGTCAVGRRDTRPGVAASSPGRPAPAALMAPATDRAVPREAPLARAVRAPQAGRAARPAGRAASAPACGTATAPPG